MWIRACDSVCWGCVDYDIAAKPSIVHRSEVVQELLLRFTIPSQPCVGVGGLECSVSVGVWVCGCVGAWVRGCVGVTCSPHAYNNKIEKCVWYRVEKALFTNARDVSQFDSRTLEMCHERYRCRWRALKQKRKKEKKKEKARAVPCRER